MTPPARGHCPRTGLRIHSIANERTVHGLQDPKLGDVIGIRSIMMLSLTYDHRIIDGAMAASFMQMVVQGLEDVDPEADLLV